MRTIILADRLGRELAPLADDQNPALLPVAGKEVIVHALEFLALGGVKKAHVVLSAQPEKMRTLLGDGRRWGMELQFSLSRGEEDPEALLARLPGGPDSDDIDLLIRGDVIRSGRLADFLRRAEEAGSSPAHGVLSGSQAWISLRTGGEGSLAPLHWPNHASGIDLPVGSAVEFGEGRVYLLSTLANYHRANLDAAGGKIDGLAVPGRQTALGLTLGRNSKLSPRNLKTGSAFVGSGCRIDPSAEFNGDVVISDNVIVDRGARLFNTVVLPHTYVGELTDLKEAIVKGNDLFRIDTGAHLRITDAFLLADLQKTTLTGAFFGPLHRLLGLLLLLISLPLWPLAIVGALQQSPKAPLLRRRLRGNRIEIGDYGLRRRVEFEALEWNLNIPILRYLPRLLAVVRGDLLLVGVEAVSAEEAETRVSEWEKLADGAPAGLIGPTQLRLGGDAPEEERLMSDAFYAAHRTSRGDLNYLGEGFAAIFSSRAWRQGA